MANELTRIIQKFNVTKDKLEAIKMDRFNKLIEEQTQKVKKLCAIVSKEIKTKKAIYMGGKSVYYDPCVVALLPNRDHFKFSAQTRNSYWSFSNGWNDTFNGFKGTLPTKIELNKFFVQNNYYKNKFDNYFIDSKYPQKEKLVTNFLLSSKMNKEDALAFSKKYLGYIPTKVKNNYD